MHSAVNVARYVGCQNLFDSAAARAAAHVVEELGEQGQQELEALGRDAAHLEPCQREGQTRLVGPEEGEPSLEYVRPQPRTRLMGIGSPY